MEKLASIFSLVFSSGHFKNIFFENACTVCQEKCTRVGELAAKVRKSFFADKNRKHESIAKNETALDSTQYSTSFDMLIVYIALIMCSRCGAVTPEMRNFKSQ